MGIDNEVDIINKLKAIREYDIIKKNTVIVFYNMEELLGFENFDNFELVSVKGDNVSGNFLYYSQTVNNAELNDSNIILKYDLHKNIYIYFQSENMYYICYYDSMIYIGNIDSNCNRSGIGKLFYINGDIYEGKFIDNKINGYGKYYFKSENYYEGEFKNELKHGKGTFYFGSNNIAYNYDKLEGEWVNNECISCKLYLKNNFIYKGEFSDLKLNGKGELFYENISVYKGLFQNNNIKI